MYKSKYKGNFVASNQKTQIMNITITGSLGNVGRPLAQQLVAAGHQVTVISHNKDKKKAIEALGATPAIGSIQDASFLTNAFTGADAVFVMTPPASVAVNIVDNTIQSGKAMATAIQQARVPRVVMLSSIGADLPDNTGPIQALFHIEKLYSEIKDTAFVFLRAGSFYLNFLQNMRRQNYGVFVRYLSYQITYFCNLNRIQAISRFIENYELRLVNDCLCQTNTLPITAR